MYSFLIFAYGFFACTYVMWVPITQKRTSDPLKMELYTIVSHHMDDGNPN